MQYLYARCAGQQVRFHSENYTSVVINSKEGEVGSARVMRTGAKLVKILKNEKYLE